MIVQDSKWNTIVTGTPQNFYKIKSYTFDLFLSDYVRPNFNQQWLTLDKNYWKKIQYNSATAIVLVSLHKSKKDIG